MPMIDPDIVGADLKKTQPGGTGGGEPRPDLGDKVTVWIG